jgi:hypothetical protein
MLVSSPSPKRCWDGESGCRTELATSEIEQGVLVLRHYGIKRRNKPTILTASRWDCLFEDRNVWA